ncbi:hypothetical protein [Flavobacterium filum]|uniref:hypothetical protein n=1 Tax=Flavobacterium filum TaxID=370974 RepID=UPI0023F1DB26|nr:hypothetical protein [Flavobacterium filum]
MYKRLYLFFSPIILIVCCKSLNQAKKQTDLSLYQDTVIHYVTLNKCLVFSFKNNDSTNKALTKTIKYDRNGQEVETVMNNFGNYIDNKEINIYNSKKQLVVSYYQPKEQQSREEISKTEYFYDTYGNLIRQTTNTLMRRIRKDVDKGMGRPGGCIITEKDYEKKKTWALETEWNFYYDSKNRLIRKKASPINSSQDLYEYSYIENSQRLAEQKSLNSKTGLIYIEKFYFKNDTTIFERFWYEQDGTRSKDFDGKLTQNYFWYEITDKNGNSIKKYIIDKDDKRIFNREEFFYDKKNRLIRKNTIDNNGKIVWTDLYIYYDNETKAQTGILKISQK